MDLWTFMKVAVTFSFCPIVVFLAVGCSPARHPRPYYLVESKETQRPLSPTRTPSVKEISQTLENKSPEDLQDTLEEYGENWLYGQGLGATLLNVGTVVIFPPYGLYLLGNAGIALAGYEPLYITDVLPDTPREEILSVYGRVASIPGNVAAKIAGREQPVQE